MVMTLTARRLERLERRLEELRSWRNARELPIANWTLTGSDGIARPMSPGDSWPLIETPVSMTATVIIPDDWAGSPVDIELSLGGEGFVQLSNGYQAGLNPFHHRFPVTDSASGGESLSIDAEVVPKGIMGSDLPDPRIDRAMLVVPHRDIRALERDIAMVKAAAVELGDHEAVPLILDAAESALSELADGWPSFSDVAVSRYVLGYSDGIGSGIHLEEDYDWIPEASDIRRPKRPTWSLPPSPRPLEPMSPDGRAAVERARCVLAEALGKVRQQYPPSGALCLTGHAHIDLAWLWPYAETRRKTRRTFSTVLDLMERYPDFRFNQSSAQVYTWIAEDDPAVFERIKDRVAEGRWEPSGGMWVEADANIPSGEAFARQLVYGQRYFDQTFGRRSTSAWLPDVFGYSGGIPQLYRGAGITGFFTAKLYWNEQNLFPYDLFTWEGIDGSRITVHTSDGYNRNIAPLDALFIWRGFRGKSAHPESLMSFGWGDGAGGPSDRMLENYARIKEFPALPRLRMGGIDDYFASVPAETLPIWVGELYFELHRGTLTSQALVKQLNRQSEHRLLEAEAFGAIASLQGFTYPEEEIESSWKALLLNQFHDVLPGSSINEVYQDTHRMLGEVGATATGLRDDALRSVQGDGDGLVVASAALNARPLQVLLPEISDAFDVRDDSGRVLPTQATDGGLLVGGADHQVPGLGWIGLTLAPATSNLAPRPARPVMATVQDDGPIALQNDQLRVVVAADGSLANLFDRAHQREALSGAGNQIWAYVDRPYTYDAWDVDETYERDGEPITSLDSIEVVEVGPVRASVRVVRTWQQSTIAQTYRLWAGSRRLDIETEIDWHQRQILLKSRFPLSLRTHEAVYETMYGVVRRPTHRNTSWDAARFEVCGHRFALMEEPGYGVALLNDAKYGHEAHRNVLSLTLLRSPLYPDPLADEGKHHFTYSLLPYAGDWTSAGVTDEAFWLNSPVVVSRGSSSGSAGFVSVEGLSLGLGALKPAFDRDGIVLRVYEPHGARGRARLTFDRDIRGARRVNLLEEPDSAATQPELLNSRAVAVDFGPFEVVSLRIRM